MKDKALERNSDGEFGPEKKREPRDPLIDGWFVGDIDGMTLDQFVTWAMSIRAAVPAGQRSSSVIDFRDGDIEDYARIRVAKAED